MKNCLGFILIFNLLLSAAPARAQQAYLNTRLNLDTLESFHDGRRSDFMLGAAKVWGKEGEKPDSVLWQLSLQDHYTWLQDFRRGKMDTAAFVQRARMHRVDTTLIGCAGIPAALYVLTSRRQGVLTLSILKRLNPGLARETVLSYPEDSLKIWTPATIPARMVPKITLDYWYCVNNKVVRAPWEFYLIPVKTAGILYNDRRLNEMPLLASTQQIRAAAFGKAKLYFVKEEFTAPVENARMIYIAENGVFQRDKILNGLRYKDGYRLADTLVIEGKLYKVDSVGHNLQSAYIHPVKATTQQVRLSPASMAILAPHFKGGAHEMMVDFWGTWCVPCIEKLPELRALEQTHGKKFSFLSICVDKPGNTKKARQIFAKHQISWPQVFTDMDRPAGTILGELGVACFPTYMIINKEGEVRFSGCGTEGFAGLKDHLLKN